jgi:ribosomal protein S18 acetylase RimI-like enzyme
MAATVTIEQAGWRHRQRALRAIVAPGRDGDFVRAQAHRLAEVVGRSALLWWARRGDAPLAGAILCKGAGRAGSVLFTPVSECPEPAVLEPLLAAATHQGLEDGLSLVQALNEPAAPEGTHLERAGFWLLASLAYMRLELRGPLKQSPGGPGLDWCPAADLPQGELEELIQRTYVDSLDCPALAGVRPMEDVMASHRSAGVYRPECWWACRREGQLAGCVLVNDSSHGAESELVYLGVASEHRGRGVGKALLGRAIEQGVRRGRRGLTLAADAANTPAVKLYKQAGLAVVRRREVWLRTKNPPPRR